ncbi:MAG: long-chain fatty acid--CoA ligase [Actinobacteria bacterium]|nr:long-chain fatty acid--CoA ligase [Actinomycetota bacterium]
MAPARSRAGAAAGRPSEQGEEAVSSDEVVRQRAEIEAVIAGRTLCDELGHVAETSGDAWAYSDEAGSGADGGWQSLTWAQTRQRALEAAAGFAALGLAPGERVALMLPNRSEHVLADLGAVHAGGLGVTLYATLAPDQIAYVAGDCDARIAVLDGAAELARWQPVLDQLPGLQKIIVRDRAACPAGDQYLTWDDFAALGRDRFAAEPGEITARVAAIKPDDPLALLYTSGTTGNPKGVVLTHRNILYQMIAADRMGILAPRVRWVSYLPLAHIAERALSIYLPIHVAAHVHFCPDPAQLVRVMGKVRPTAFFGVPRVWEKVRAGIQALLAAEQDEGKRAAVQQAMDIGRRYVESCQYGRTTSPDVAARFRAADEAVLGPVRGLLGLGEAGPVLSAAAPLPPDVAAFFAGLGLKILDIYGMTETTGAFTANTPAGFKLGTVGRPYPGMEVRIAGDGEILARGPLNTPGYLGRPELTDALIDADGWLHTGDVGTIDADGFVSVTDRKKELIITAGGENIAPAAVENLLVAHPLIGQALAYGDGRPYVVALLTLDGEAAPAWARARGISAGSLAALAADPRVLAEVAAGVAAANERLARVQQVKYWRLLPVEWTAETEELTPTLKLKRRIVHAKYADVIDTLYAG